jgi:nitrogen fixation/metabolism regulation signal transduction histidine kinase
MPDLPRPDPRGSWLRREGLYLVVAHALFAALLVAAYRQRPLWLLGSELALALSLVVGFALLRRAAIAQELLRPGVELLRERDFGSHLLPVGHPEADALAELFNRMSDRLREERLRLEEQNFLLDRVLAASPVGVLTLDHDGRVALLNEAAAKLLRAAPAGTAVGESLASLPGPLARELVTLGAGESRLVPLEGRRRLKCYRGQFFDRGFPRSFYLLEEVTEELRTSEKAAYEQLVRMISHEVSNSVGAVSSLLESCVAYGEQLRAGDREDFRQALAVASARLHSLNAFVNGFAEVVRLPPPDRRPTDLGALVDDVRVLLQPELERRRIACRWAAREPLEPLSLDRHQMEQVVVNVFRNAVEAIGEDGEITLALRREEGRPTLRVADSGAGIAREAEARLFVPFFSTKRDGRGLGLVLIREVVGQHGMGCALANRPEGGAEFVLRA